MNTDINYADIQKEIPEHLILVDRNVLGRSLVMLQEELRAYYLKDKENLSSRLPEVCLSYINRAVVDTGSRMTYLEGVCKTSEEILDFRDIITSQSLKISKLEDELKQLKEQRGENEK